MATPSVTRLSSSCSLRSTRYPRRAPLVPGEPPRSVIGPSVLPRTALGASCTRAASARLGHSVGSPPTTTVRWSFGSRASRMRRRLRLTGPIPRVQPCAHVASPPLGHRVEPHGSTTTGFRRQRHRPVCADARERVRGSVPNGRRYSPASHVRAENARLLRLLELTPQQARPPGPVQTGVFDGRPGPVHAELTAAAKVAFFASLFAARRRRVRAAVGERRAPAARAGCPRCAAAGARASQPPSGSTCR